MSVSSVAEMSILSLGFARCVVHVTFTSEMLTTTSIAFLAMTGMIVTCFFLEHTTSRKIFKICKNVLFLMHTTTSTYCVRALLCTELGDKRESYLDADLSIQCDSSEYIALYAYAICMIVFIAVGTPAFLFGILYMHFEELATEEALDLLGDQYMFYKDEAWWFDSVEYARKVIMTSGLMILATGSSAQIFVGSLMVSISLWIFIYFRPYRRQNLHNLQMIAHLSLLVFMLCGFALKTGSLESEGYYDGNSTDSLSVLVIFVLLWPYGAAVYYVRKDALSIGMDSHTGFNSEARTNLQSFRERIRRKTSVEKQKEANAATGEQNEIKATRSVASSANQVLCSKENHSELRVPKATREVELWAHPKSQYTSHSKSQVHKQKDFERQNHFEGPLQVKAGHHRQPQNEGKHRGKQHHMQQRQEQWRRQRQEQQQQQQQQQRWLEEHHRHQGHHGQKHVPPFRPQDLVGQGAHAFQQFKQRVDLGPPELGNYPGSYPRNTHVALGSTGLTGVGSTGLNVASNASNSTLPSDL